MKRRFIFYMTKYIVLRKEGFWQAEDFPDNHHAQSTPENGNRVKYQWQKRVLIIKHSIRKPERTHRGTDNRVRVYLTKQGRDTNHTPIPLSEPKDHNHEEITKYSYDETDFIATDK
ncbi:MAG: hypothetical protein VB042_09875 [Victivallaceae bacterium]|nr:hypothetical protein [Victivallaceae bacterium]